MFIPWDDLQIGTETGRIEITVTDAMLDEYLDVMDFDASVMPASGEGRLVPPDLVAKHSMTALFQDFCQKSVGPNIRAKQAFEFRRAIAAGTKLTAVARLVEKYEKRDKRFVVLEGVFTDAAGREVLVDRRTQLILPPKPETK